VDDFRVRHVNDYDLDLDAYVNPVCGMAGAGVRPWMISNTTANVMGRIGIRGGGLLHQTYWGGHSASFDRSTLLGLMEAHERIAGSRPRRFTGLIMDTYRNVSREALDPVHCGLYTEEFYAGSDHFVRYHEDLTIPWVWGHSLRDDRPILVSAELTYYHMANLRNRYLQECSNGCASGGCLEEAIHHGLLELIERDAFLIAWYAKPQLTEIDPRSSANPQTRMIVDRIAMYGYDVRFFDTRIEFPIPVVTVVARRRDGGMGTLLFAAGASLDPEEAIASGLGEIASEVSTFARDTERVAAALREKAADFDKVEMLDDHATLYGLPEMAGYADHFFAGDRAPRPVSEVYRDWYAERPQNLDLTEDLRYCVDQVVAAGFDVIAVDQTSPEQQEIGLHTASVLVPGLVPIDFGWGKQRALHMDRTRTALRRAGLRETNLEPHELNLAPHPFP
jgi:ribosomal protein S12 methylthiotransferase accessory factor